MPGEILVKKELQAVASRRSPSAANSIAARTGPALAREITQNLLHGHPRRQVVEHVVHGHTRTNETRLTAADLGMCFDQRAEVHALRRDCA